MEVGQDTVKSYIEINALLPLSPHVKDALYSLLGNHELAEAYEAGDIPLFESLCPSSAMPRMLWAEADNIVRDLTAFLATGGAILPSMNFEQNPDYENAPDENIVYHDYRYNAYYNVKQYNPMWWNMVGNGEPYETCGYMVHTEFEVCRNTQGHFNSKAENKWVLRKRAIGCNRFECPVDYVKACAYQAIKVATRFARMPHYNKHLDSGIAQVSVLGKNNPVKGFRTLQKKFHRKQVTSPEDKSQFGFPVHITLSPSQEWMELTKSSKDHRRLVRKLYHIIRKLGIIGGCII